MATKTTRGKAAPIPVIIDFVLDETGSMNRHVNATIGGFNDYVTEQRTGPGICQMTLTKFEGGKLSTPYEDLNLAFVPMMTPNTFIPGGGTNLFDAIVSRINSRLNANKEWSVEPNVLLVVMTDGADNQSRHTVSDVRMLIELVQDKGWTCVYLGADQNALRIGKEMGFREGNIKSFASSEIQETLRTTSAATTVFRAATVSGASTQNFF